MRPILSYLLVRNKNQCKNCGTCSRLLPDFIRVYAGELIISESNYRQEEVKNAVDSVIDACPHECITLETRIL